MGEERVGVGRHRHTVLTGALAELGKPRVFTTWSRKLALASPTLSIVCEAEAPQAPSNRGRAGASPSTRTCRKRNAVVMLAPRSPTRNDGSGGTVPVPWRARGTRGPVDARVTTNRGTSASRRISSSASRRGTASRMRSREGGPRCALLPPGYSWLETRARNAYEHCSWWARRHRFSGAAQQGYRRWRHLRAIATRSLAT